MATMELVSPITSATNTYGKGAWVTGAGSTCPMLPRERHRRDTAAEKPSHTLRSPLPSRLEHRQPRDSAAPAARSPWHPEPGASLPGEGPRHAKDTHHAEPAGDVVHQPVDGLEEGVKHHVAVGEGVVEQGAEAEVPVVPQLLRLPHQLKPPPPAQP